MNYYIVSVDFLLPHSETFLCTESKLIKAVCPKQAKILTLELYSDSPDVLVRLSCKDVLQINKEEARVYACLTSGQKSFLSDKFI